MITTDQPTSDRRNTAEYEPRRRVVLRGTPAITAEEREQHAEWLRELNLEMKRQRHEH